MKSQNEWISCCGSDCGTCSCYGKICNGCNALCGKVFHAPEGKACPIYECCRNQHHFHSCIAVRGKGDPNSSQNNRV